MYSTSSVSVFARLYYPYILTILFSLEFTESFKESLIILVGPIHMSNVKSKRDSKFEWILVTVMIVLLDIPKESLLITEVKVALQSVIYFNIDTFFILSCT
jgi:hypothetical protein